MDMDSGRGLAGAVRTVPQSKFRPCTLFWEGLPGCLSLLQYLTVTLSPLYCLGRPAGLLSFLAA